MPLSIVGQELAFETGHIDPNRALRLTRATFETEVEHAVDPFVAQPHLAERPLHRLSQHVGSSSGRVGFVAGRHIRRTHRARLGLATCPHAAAHLDRPTEATMLRVIEEGGGVGRDKTGAIPQIGRQRR